MTDTQVTDVVTFDFKGTGVRCIVCGTIGYKRISFWCTMLLNVHGL